MEKYEGIFPSILFMSADFTPMHFILALNGECTEELLEIMEHCSAKVTCNLYEATGHSIVLVDHNEPVTWFRGPVFSIDYIQKCLKEKKLLDISEYKQAATEHPAEGNVCMQVVYFKLQTWDDVAEKDSLDNEHKIDSNAREKSKEYEFQLLSEEEELTEFVQSKKICLDEPDVAVNGVEEYDLEKSHSPLVLKDLSDDEELETDFSAGVVKRFVCSTQIENDVNEENSEGSDAILQATNENRQNNDTHSQEDGVIQGSEIEEFDKILKNPAHVVCKKWISPPPMLQNETGVEYEGSSDSEEQVQEEADEERKDEDGEEKRKWDEEEEMDPRVSTPPMLQNETGVVYEGSSDSEEQVQDEADEDRNDEDGEENRKGKEDEPEEMNPTCRGIEDSKWLSKTSQSSPKKRSTARLPQNQIDSEDSGVTRKNMTSKHSRMPYTVDERHKILHYIVERNEYGNVKGTLLWKCMERKKVLPFRTWQSMKEHFLKKIMTDLSPYHFLTDNQIRKLKQFGL